MSASILESIYNGAASIAKPLSLAALLVTFLTIIIRQVVIALARPLSEATSRDAVNVVLAALRYLFVLSLLALFGGLASYILEFFLQDYVKKYALIDSARAAMAMEDPREIRKYADNLIKNYPEYSEGYHYRGIGSFYEKNYIAASSDFAKALEYLVISKDKCDEKRRDFVFNLAAAQAAAGNYPAALVSMKSMDSCWSGKSELFNYGKIMLMNGEFSDAERTLTAEKLNDSGRPDYISRVWMERGILSIVRKRNDWIKESTEHFKKAISHNVDFAQIIVCSKISNKIEPPGMIEDFDYELSVLDNPLNAKYMKIIRSSLKGSELCGV